LFVLGSGGRTKEEELTEGEDVFTKRESWKVRVPGNVF